MSSRHLRDIRRLRPEEISRQRQPFKVGHHVNARERAARRRGQCPKPRHEDCAVGASRRGIDRDEHSATIRYVMADVPPYLFANMPRHRRADRGRIRQRHVACSGANNAAHIRAHRHTRSRGVSDPWGRGLNQSPGRGGGSLTPRLHHHNPFARGTKRRTQPADRCPAIRRKSYRTLK